MLEEAYALAGLLAAEPESVEPGHRHLALLRVPLTAAAGGDAVCSKDVVFGDPKRIHNEHLVAAGVVFVASARDRRVACQRWEAT